MNIIAGFFESRQSLTKDQSAIPPSSLDEIMHGQIRSSAAYLDRVFSDSEMRSRVLAKVGLATDNVYEILHKIAWPSTQLVFAGASTSLGIDLLSSRRKALEKYPDVGMLLKHSAKLNSDQNNDFRRNGFSLKVKPGAVIVDEYAEHLVKANELLSGPLNARKMVVIAIPPEHEMNAPAILNLRKFEGERFFYGLQDRELVHFMSDLAHLRSNLVSINGGFGVWHDDTIKRIRWNRSTLSHEHNEIVSRAEETDHRWKTFFTDGLSV